MIVEIAGLDYARIAVFDAGEGWPPTRPIDYHLIGLSLLRSMLAVPLAYIAAFQVADDTMAPTIGARDRVLVDCSQTEIVSPGLYAIDVNGSVVVKRASRHFEADAVTLVSDNAKYPAEVISPSTAISPIGRVFLSVVRC